MGPSSRTIPLFSARQTLPATTKRRKALSNLRAQAGTMSSSVANIHVTGDSATADVTATFSKAPGTVQDRKLSIRQRGRQLEGVHSSGFIGR